MVVTRPSGLVLLRLLSNQFRLQPRIEQPGTGTSGAARILRAAKTVVVERFSESLRRTRRSSPIRLDGGSTPQRYRFPHQALPALPQRIGQFVGGYAPSTPFRNRLAPPAHLSRSNKSESMPCDISAPRLIRPSPVGIAPFGCYETHSRRAKPWRGYPDPQPS